MHLAIQLIGPPQFQLDHVPITPSRRAVVALLAYLAVSDLEHPGQRFTRESLAALLWTEYDPAKALSNLRHTLWEVTKFIGEGWVIAEHETVSLNSKTNITLDVSQFRSLRAQANGQSEPARRIPLLTEAARLYRDDFLSGFSLKEGPSFNEWMLSKATSLRHEFVSILGTLIEDYHALNQPQLAVPHAQRLIELDTINEAAHRTLMQLYALTNQQTAAIQQYRSLEKLLRKELNLDPQLETRELYKRIRKGDFNPVSSGDKISTPDKRKPLHNLPLHLTTFIGRERERDQISRLLLQNRLVTLIGAGGIGKTRLSVQTGQSLLDNYADGVWFIPLESITDGDLVPQTIADSLNVEQSSEMSALEAVVSELRGKSTLLILDNCEHLLDACARLADALLKNCLGLSILATSREALHLEGEALFRLFPLAIPDPGEHPTEEELGHYGSIRLFLDRARLVVSGFELTEVNAETVVKICRRLDGIPLAIELAAAQTDIFTLEEILEQLRHSFDLLASNTRSALPRHETMRASIDWDWKLLSEMERVFMRQMSVFIGGWTLHAAQSVGLTQARELTGALLKKSFVIAHQQAGHETRYSFHEVIRSYAQEKLVEAGEEPAMRDRQLDYFLELSQQLEPALQGIDQGLWLDRLFVERDNMRAALEWAARTHVQAGLYLSNRLKRFWESCELREEARWLLTI